MLNLTSYNDITIIFFWWLDQNEAEREFKKHEKEFDKYREFNYLLRYEFIDGIWECRVLSHIQKAATRLQRSRWLAGWVSELLKRWDIKSINGIGEECLVSPDNTIIFTVA